MAKTIFLAAFAGFAAAETVEHVITGTAKNWDSLLETHSGGLLAEFYAPWCGHCKKLIPEYEKAAATLAADGSAVKLVKIDATVETTLASKYEVSGYPSLKWFTAGEPMEYDGPREADGIVAWIKGMSGPAVVEGAPKEDDAFSVAWYGAESSFFEEVAKVNRKKASWYFVKGDGAGKVVLKHKGEDAIESTPANKEELEEFFASNKFPIYGAMDGESYGNYLQDADSGMVWVLLEMTATNVDEVVSKDRAMYTAMAKELKADKEHPLKVSWTNTIEFKKVLEGMFSVTEFPRLIINMKMGDRKNFIYDGEMTQDAMMTFIKKVKSGDVQPNLKSEEPPAEQTEPVKVVVGKTLEEMVFTADKDVFLEVYAPWCGHCKKLEPEYTKVAKKVEKEGMSDIITIAKMDGTLNDSPVDSISWSGFPTLVYVKAGSTEVIKYEDARDAKGIWKWIKANHSQKDEIKTRLTKKQEKKKEEL